MSLEDEFDRERCEAIAEYIINTGATVRAAAVCFGISKSTVHKDITEKLEKVNHSMYLKVKVILEQNKAERHLRGGEATRVKYIKLKENRHKKQSSIL